MLALFVYCIKMKRRNMEINIDENIKYWIWFSRIDKIKSINKKRLIQKYISPKKLYNLKRNELKVEKYLSNEEIEEILKPKYRNYLYKYQKYMEDNQIAIIDYWSKDYPQKLKNIYDSPVILYAKGNINLLNSDGIAIVGSRNCTNYGKKVCNQIACDIAKENICVISGLAKGIDSYAHIGALISSGKTIAVIGNGLDNIYPSENKKLANEIIENGGLIISEYIIGTNPDKLNFPRRNRIISGLSDGIVVVEAKEKSGSLITVDFGIEQGKEIFAVPGNITSLNSVGTNKLIKDGANIVTNFKDILDTCYNFYNYK